MVCKGFNLMFVCLSNQGFKHLGLPHKCNFQSGSALGNHWVPSLAFSPICESVIHTQTHSLGLMGPCTSHLVTNPMLGLWHAKCNFWDYDYGWACSIHDWALFQKNKLKKLSDEKKYLLYKLIRDVTYPMCPWFYFPFKGEKDWLLKYKTH